MNTFCNEFIFKTRTYEGKISTISGFNEESNKIISTNNISLYSIMNKIDFMFSC